LKTIAIPFTSPLLYTQTMRVCLLFAVALVVLAQGCAENATEESSCESIVGKEYITVMAKFDCGPPDGAKMCSRTLEFRSDASFGYYFSDFGDAGMYTCSEGILTGEGDFATYTGTVDVESGELTWDNELFKERN